MLHPATGRGVAALAPGIRDRGAQLGPARCLPLGAYTGMRLTEAVAFAWSQVGMAAVTVRIADTKRGEPLEFPVTRQLAAILERRFAERALFAGEARG